MVIIKQCLICKDKGKKIYCKDCEKSIDYFDVFEIVPKDNKDTMPILIHTVKAYTWNDVIKFIKDRYFKDQKDTIIDCEKEFAYLQGRTKTPGSLTNLVKEITSYKIYLKKENNIDLENTIKSKTLIDLIT